MTYNEIFTENLYIKCINGKSERTESIKKVIDQIPHKEVTYLSVPPEDYYVNSTTNGHIIATTNAITTNSFPCLILEDDCEIMRQLPPVLKWSGNDVDIIYLGGSLHHEGSNFFTYINYDDYNFRTFNLLCLHSYIIPNEKSAHNVLNILINARQDNIPGDLNLAKHSFKNIFITPKEGMFFYQNNENHKLTCFKLYDEYIF